jgi:cell division protein FtsX
MRPRLEAAVMHTREGLRLLLARPVASLATACAVTLALLALALTTWLLLRVSDVVTSLDKSLILHAALDPALDEAQTKETLVGLAALEGVESVRWVGPKAQREALVEAVGPTLLEGLDDAVFPAGGMAELVLTREFLESETSDPGALAARITRLAGVSGVDTLPYDPTHIALLSGGASMTRTTGTLLALLALLTAVLCSFLLIRDGLVASRKAIALLSAFGATQPFIQARFLFAATLVGLAGGGLALALGLAIQGPLVGLVTLLPDSGDAGLVGLGYVVLCLLGGPGLSLGGGLLALRRHEDAS